LQFKEKNEFYYYIKYCFDVNKANIYFSFLKHVFFKNRAKSIQNILWWLNRRAYVHQNWNTGCGWSVESIAGVKVKVMQMSRS